MCHEDSWDVRGLSANIPIEFLDVSSGFNFCPAKLFRDDVDFVFNMQHLWVGWKTGQLLEDGNFSTIDEETICDLYDMINLWERTERETNLFRLGMMLCGDPDDNKSNPGPKNKG